jgi:hypothetical protein
MIDSRVLRRIFGPKRKDAREDEECDVVSSTVIESRKME